MTIQVLLVKLLEDANQGAGGQSEDNVSRLESSTTCAVQVSKDQSGDQQDTGLELDILQQRLIAIMVLLFCQLRLSRASEMIGPSWAFQAT